MTATATYTKNLTVPDPTGRDASLQQLSETSRACGTGATQAAILGAPEFLAGPEAAPVYAITVVGGCAEGLFEYDVNKIFGEDSSEALAVHDLFGLETVSDFLDLF